MMGWFTWVTLGLNWAGFATLIYRLTDDDRNNDPTADALATAFLHNFQSTLATAGVKELDQAWVDEVSPHFGAIIKSTLARTSPQEENK